MIADLSHFHALDGLRGALVLSIVVAHIHLSLFPGALILMDVFFVLSGFLITRVLHRNLLSSGSLQFGKFWWRRFWRLAPALYVLLLVYALAVPWVQGNSGNVLSDVLIAGSYTTNWFKAENFFKPYYLGHTWSLATEEQFYLLWPLFLWCLFRSDIKADGLWRILLVLAAICQLWRWYLLYDGASVTRLYHALDVRLDGFFIGGALYFWYVSRARGFPPGVGWVSAAVIVITTVLVKGMASENFTWMQPLVVWSSFLLIGSLVTHPKEGISSLFRQSLLMLPGKICYSLYLWHFPILALTEKYWHVSSWLRIPSMLLLIGIVSVASYHWLESPLLNRKSR